jgi:hypothetical protein
MMHEDKRERHEPHGIQFRPIVGALLFDLGIVCVPGGLGSESRYRLSFASESNKNLLPFKECSNCTRSSIDSERLEPHLEPLAFSNIYALDQAVAALHAVS